MSTSDNDKPAKKKLLPLRKGKVGFGASDDPYARPVSQAPGGRREDDPENAEEAPLSE